VRTNLGKTLNTIEVLMLKIVGCRLMVSTSSCFLESMGSWFIATKAAREHIKICFWP
jgi:hypothetical protein